MKKLQLLGEFECKVDAKGRMRIPAQLIKQMGESDAQTFVVNRGFEKNLMLYPKEVWDNMIAQISELNQFDRNNRKFIRYIYRGAQQLEVDASDRVLIKKQLLEFADIGKEVVLFAQGDQIEIWSKEEYERQMAMDDDEDFAQLAEVVMKNKGRDKTENE